MEANSAEHILEVISREVGKVCTIEQPLDSLGLDSLDFVELVRQLEIEFSVIVPDVAIAKLHTIGDLVSLVSQLQNRGLICR